jgi:hypothetical protein
VESLYPKVVTCQNDDDPNKRVQFCECFNCKVHEVEEFASKSVLSDEATLKLNGTVKYHHLKFPVPLKNYLALLK